mmetsp:Transcript_34341/g.42326  ORF Transcript_34341/g.42326 Transcript_34341/m.42326 type:complete len:269 (+) Transcript_34341:177-983(+)
MASVNVTNIVVLDNPSKFVDPFKFEITFECVRQLSSDLEWRVTYVGSAESEKADQVLDSILVGPVPMGVNRFVFEAPAPDHTKIPNQDLLGVTVVLLSCLYRSKEFIRIGYYVNNEYDDENAVYENGKRPVVVGEEMDIEGSEGEEEDEEDEEEEEDEEDEEEDDKDENPKEDTAEKKGSENKENSTEQDKDKADEKESTDEPASKKVKTETTEITETTGAEEKPKPKETVNAVPIPKNFEINKVKRSVLQDKPRVTRFSIDWEDHSE